MDKVKFESKIFWLKSLATILAYKTKYNCVMGFFKNKNKNKKTGLLSLNCKTPDNHQMAPEG